MKGFSVCFWLSLSALLPLGAAADDTQANVNIEPSPTLTHNALSKITVQYLDASYGIADNVDVSGITLSLKGSTDVLYALPNPSIEWAKLTLEFAHKGETEPETVTREGIYSLHIPEGAVYRYDTMSPLGAVDALFTVSANATTEMSRYELTPAPGRVEEISTVQLSFPDSKGLDWFYNNLWRTGNFSAITLSSKSNPELRYTAIKKDFDKNLTVTLGFTDANGEVTLTTPGTYVLDIPADMFRKDYPSVPNEHITAEYVIGQAVAPEFEEMISSPAEGERVGQFSELTLTFPNMPDGLQYPIENIAEATLTTPSGETFYGFSPNVGSAAGGTYNRLTLHFAPQGAISIDQACSFTGAGTYTVNIPAGILKADGKEAANSDISLTFSVDPMLNFTYNVSPAPDICHQTFEDITFSCGDSLTSLSVNTECTEAATISLDNISYTLSATPRSDTEVTLTLPADAQPSPGTWTVRVPADFFSGVNAEGITIHNAAEITLPFEIKIPEQFSYKIDPADGATVEFFKNVTLEFYGNNLKEVRLNPEAGNPVMTGNGGSISLAARLSGRYVILTASNGEEIADGTYTLVIPAGYVSTVDSDKLIAEVGEITTSLTVARKAAADYTDGILFLNEGWFGHDPGSLNFLGNNGEWTYDVFARNNAGHSLGITSQFGQCFGSKVFVVNKMSGGDQPADGGVFTAINASDMKFAGQLLNLPDEQTSPRAFCAWDEHKGYLSTSDHIYTVNLDAIEIMSVVPGTDIFTKFDSNGDMLRYGDHVFAIRQSSGVDAIDPATDDVTKIPAELAVGFAVTPDGSLYVATRNESNEFVKISPLDLTITETFDIPEDYAKIANVWSTWRSAPLAADIRSNAVFYVTQKAADESMAGARYVARYDFDNKKFDEKFITLPGIADGEDADWVLYGSGVSVDPATGYVLLTAVESGYGTHYRKNRVFVADPATGEILPGRTHVLDDAYWFPAMALYPDFDAPVIDSETLTFPEGESSFTLDVAAATTLRTGNIHLINYSAVSSDSEVCTVASTDTPGVFNVTMLAPDSFGKITVSADYQGKISTVELSNGSVSADFVTDLPAKADVYNMLGIRVLRDATPAEVRALPSGIYIVNGRKFIVR